MLHIWHEDSTDSSTTQFLNFLKQNRLTIKLSNADIQGLNGNDSLIDKLENTVIQDTDIYLVLFDNVIDNPDVITYKDRLITICNKHRNVIEANLLCFEYIILSFIYLDKWTKPISRDSGYGEALKMRELFMQGIHSGVNWGESKILLDYICKLKQIDVTTLNGINKLNRITSEHVASLILSRITGTSKSGFIVNKRTLGLCWTCECRDKCDHSILGDTDNWRHCYLNNTKPKTIKASQAKACELYYGTELYKILKQL